MPILEKDQASSQTSLTQLQVARLDKTKELGKKTLPKDVMPLICIFLQDTLV